MLSVLFPLFSLLKNIINIFTDWDKFFKSNRNMLFKMKKYCNEIENKYKLLKTNWTLGWKKKKKTGYKHNENN